MSGWVEDLIMGPSQCYFFVVFKDTRYCLYLRWRDRNPWKGYIIKDVQWVGTITGGKMSDDLLKQRGLYFRQEEHKKAQSAMMLAWNDYVKGKVNISFGRN